MRRQVLSSLIRRAGDSVVDPNIPSIEEPKQMVMVLTMGSDAQVLSCAGFERMAAHGGCVLLMKNADARDGQLLIGLAQDGGRLCGGTTADFRLFTWFAACGYQMGVVSGKACGALPTAIPDLPSFRGAPGFPRYCSVLARFLTAASDSMRRRT